MTHDETLTILAVLQSAYPNFYRGMNKQQADAVHDLWATMFADDPVEIVAVAVKGFIATDAKGFPPHIGAIKDAIRKITQPPELEMSELEAWNEVRYAIRGASMEDWSRRLGPDGIGPPSAVVKFKALPPILQRLVGTPKQLADWERLPDDEINTIIQSNFMRSFRARAANEREYLALPSEVRKTMETLAAGTRLPQLTDGGA